MIKSTIHEGFFRVKFTQKDAYDLIKSSYNIPISPNSIAFIYTRMCNDGLVDSSCPDVEWYKLDLSEIWS